MQILNVREARAQISRLLDAVEQGEEIIIQRNGKAIARLVATHAGSQRARFPDRRAFRRNLPPCREPAASTVRALRDDELS